ncbi:MAG: 1-deoxy-D-xylulose-5-phosphate reductoisomerase [Candidatus Mcinerneyibacterium aminivorans]|uniref:1-deoxy-D-xylulose 5-phosphate reductoisomerase n=1 Tax=Candidatus Mcinerneyibacterium aminivorans TaxID=2703815 RepID=A0A5D0MFQ3_9BACT|nr:MAG: 1-deoxy-D-xylulose-5-phosphate reductoisomerase [Candidatus Mcinerneyibacterium aminivorans]
MKEIAVFGSTGSIGTSTLDVIEKTSEINLKSLVFGRNVNLAEEQIKKFKPTYIGSIKKNDSKYLYKKYDFIKNYFYGTGIKDLAKGVYHDIFLSAISGSDGLASSINALSNTRRIALANKETMVMAGKQFNKIAEKNEVEILPVDSEHSAIFQCLIGEDKSSLKEIILTASGGPFRETEISKFKSITPEEALDHPNWDMGKKITIDSATMANKGLELIEASYLFKVPENNIKVIIHPQSIIHSMVKFKDNSIKAQLSKPDMKLAIQYALNFPERETAVINDMEFDLDLSLTFQEVSYKRFPTMKMARYSLKKGGVLPLVFNRANEESVYAFLEKRIKFVDIFEIIEKFLKKYENKNIKETLTVDEILSFDEKLKKDIQEGIDKRCY